jgi:uncharacterized membrane protein
MVAGAVIAFMFTEELDWKGYTGAVSLPGWLDQGGAADARSLLGATAGAIITTLGLVLSITVLTLSIAACQFGQRLLRRYMRDQGTQVCIGVFASAFVFTLLTLLSVTSRPNEREYVPWLTIWISTLWTLACIGVLIYYINHVALSIQVNNVLADLSADFDWAVQSALKTCGRPGMPLPDLKADLELTTPCAGYLQSIDYPALVAAAAQRDAVIRFLYRPGQFVLSGTVVAVAESEGASRSGLEDVFQRAIAIGVGRTLHQDPEFAIAQIVEIAMRAMSPGINDPNTALTCVNWISEALRKLAERPPGGPFHFDAKGKLRVIECDHDFEEVASTAFVPLRQVARSSTLLTMSILNGIASTAPLLTNHSARKALKRQAQLTFEGFRADAVASDRQDAATAYGRAVDALSEREVSAESSAANRPKTEEILEFRLD